VVRPVVFDCDGVLVDSEHLSWEVWRRVAGPYGVEISEDQARSLTGRTEVDAHAALSGGRLPPFEEFWVEIAEEMYRTFQTHLQSFEDARDVLDHLEGRTRMAVASSSPRERLDVALQTTGLGHYFEFIVAGDEVEAGKPAPDLFLAAAAGLGVDPTECVAVEDSPNGITAARAAGMRVVAVDRGYFPVTELGAAHLVVPRLTPAVFL
jgi:HAD superfamily hydrolase (TIGR01509 family)